MAETFVHDQQGITALCDALVCFEVDVVAIEETLRPRAGALLVCAGKAKSRRTVIFLELVAHAHGRAEFGIAIGERRGRGTGTEATRLVVDFALHVLQLRNVMVETLDWNADVRAFAGSTSAAAR